MIRSYCLLSFIVVCLFLQGMHVFFHQSLLFHPVYGHFNETPCTSAYTSRLIRRPRPRPISLSLSVIGLLLNFGIAVVGLSAVLLKPLSVSDISIVNKLVDYHRLLIKLSF